jgi:hypothetical protein
MSKFFGIGPQERLPAAIFHEPKFPSRLEAAPTADREQLLLQPYWAKPCNSKNLNIECQHIINYYAGVKPHMHTPADLIEKFDS